MSERVHEVIFGVTGQTISIYPPEAILGVPSSASAIVFKGAGSNDDASADVFTPAVSVDSVSTTVDAASGYSQTNRRKLNLTATTGVDPGIYYLLENVDEQKEIVEPVQVVAADYLTLRNDLAYDYAAAATSTLKGIRLTFPVDDTWVADETNINLSNPELRDEDLGGVSIGTRSAAYRVLWTYTIASVVRKWQTYLRLVRKQFKSGVTPESLMRRWPDLANYETREGRGQKFSYAITVAEDLVRADMLADGVRPEQIQDTEIVGQLVRSKALWVIAAQGSSPGMVPVEVFKRDMEREYESLRSRFITNLKVDVDQGTEGATTTSPVQTFSFTR